MKRYSNKIFKDNQAQPTLLRLALAQINPAVGDLKGNSQKVIDFINKAKSSEADLVCFPELAVTGFPPNGLLLKKEFVRENIYQLRRIAKSCQGILALVGFVDCQNDKLYNACGLLYNGKIIAVYHKRHILKYGDFDEARFFSCGDTSPVFSLGGVLFKVKIGESDFKAESCLKGSLASRQGLIIVLNASAYCIGKLRDFEKKMGKQALERKAFIASVNLVGGQDELVFAGQSAVVDYQGRLVARADSFAEELLLADIQVPFFQKSGQKAKLKAISPSLNLKKDSHLINKIEPVKDDVAEVYEALKLGLKDYVQKNNFSKVVLGLSGGIDSSLVAVLACDALGKENVVGVFMPSVYTSEESRRDAEQLANNLGIRLIEIPINEIYKQFGLALKDVFNGLGEDVTEENIQARIRGSLLMALANKFGWLVLATGNKSELGTGYATLYGDMAGGFAVIKDVYKTLVYRLARYRNSLVEVIPQGVFTKAPTAELRPNQKDSDTLPGYEILDKALRSFIEENKDIAGLVRAGISLNMARRIVRMVAKSEYKRRQSALGVKITPSCLGKDFQLPVVNKYYKS